MRRPNVAVARSSPGSTTDQSGTTKLPEQCGAVFISVPDETAWLSRSRGIALWVPSYRNGCNGSVKPDFPHLFCHLLSA